MGVTAHASGTQAAVIGQEHFLSSPAVAGTYTLHVDTVNMAAGDTLELRIYQKVLAGGVARVAYFFSWTGAQQATDLIKISVPISNDLAEADALRCSLKQTAGTGRSFPWKLLRYA